jgi:outer membrane protein TolC
MHKNQLQLSPHGALRSFLRATVALFTVNACFFTASVDAQPAASNINMQPAASSINAQPVASSINAQPVASSINAQPVASNTNAALSASPITLSPASTPELNRKIKVLDHNSNYSTDIQKQETPQQVGSAVVERTPAGQPGTSTVENNSQQFIQLERPPLTALISVNRNLNPFGLDSAYRQRVGLRDVLIAASGENLAILSTFANLQAQKWFYRNALTDYLPNINLGFNEVGLNSIAAIPIQATAVTAATGPVTSLATQTIIRTPLTVLNSGFTWKPIQGGRLLFTALYQKHQVRALKAQLKANISDVLVNAANDYQDLIYNEALLQIRTAAMETSAEQVRQNTSLESSGLATNLDVLQAKTQVSKDRQNLVEQQRLRRAASIKLAHDLNLNLGQDLLPAENILRKVRLISPDLTINQLLMIAIDNRAELKRYEELRLAAKKQIMIARSDMLPTVSLGGNIIGLASNIGQMQPTFLLNFGVTWKFDGLGMKSMTSAEAFRWQSRRAMLDANQQFLDVMEQVRNTYNQTITSEQAIDESTNEVISAEEELRLARMRLDNGLGTNLEVLVAQRDLTQARLDKALALINFNKAQAQLLHDIGLISVDNLSAGLIVSAANVPKRATR